MKRTFCLILTLLCWPALLPAQTGLAIQEAFSKYAVRSDATEVIIEGSRLKRYRLSRFHSLEIKDISHGEPERIEALIRLDTKSYLSREGNMGNTPVTSVFYEIPGKGRLHCYIFYRRTEGKLVLIYIEGHAEINELKHFFQKRK